MKKQKNSTDSASGGILLNNETKTKRQAETGKFSNNFRTEVEATKTAVEMVLTEIRNF